MKVALLTLSAGLLSSLALADVVEDALPTRPVPTPHEIVDAGFERMLNYPAVRSTLVRVFRGERMVAYRAFDAVYSRLEGQGHTFLRFTNPAYLRDNALLVIENESGSDDAWLYQPELGRPRRVGTHQKRDSFFGTDLTFEDFEHPDWKHYRLRRLPDVEVDGRSFYLVEAGTPDDSGYTQLHVRVEKETLALSQVEFFRGTPPKPVKTLKVDLDQISVENGFYKPKRIEVRQAQHDAWTEIQFPRIEIEEEISEGVFATRRLEGEEDLFDLVRRMQRASETE